MQKYLFYYLRSQETQLAAKGQGSTLHRSIGRRYIHSIDVPVPPLETQKRISYDFRENPRAEAENENKQIR